MRLGFLGALVLGAAGLAAAPAFAQPPSFDWSGFYAGVQGGFGQSTATTTGTLDYSSNGQYFWGNPNSWLNQSHSWTKSVTSRSPATGEVGAFAGYNFQLPNHLVFGAETDINWTGDRSTGDDYLHIGHCHWGACLAAHDLATSTDWYGTVRARLGESIGPLLLYGTGGLAYGDVTSTGDVFMNAPGHHQKYWDSFSDTGVRVGWTAGAGAQLAINQRVSVKFEFLHVDLGEADLFSHASKPVSLVHCSPGESTFTGSLKDALAFDTVKIGLAIRFP